MIMHLKIDWHCQRWDPQTKLSKHLHCNSHDIMSKKNAPEVLRKIGTKKKALKSKRNKYYRDTSWPMCACKSFTRLPSKMFQEQNQNSKISVRKSLLELYLCAFYDLKSKQLFTLIMSTGWMTQVAPMPDKPPFINGLTALHTDTGTFVSSDRDAILAWAMFLSLSLSLFSSTHCYLSVYLCISLDRLLARSFAIGRPLERSKSAKTTSDPVSKKGPSTTQQGKVKTEANRWRIEDGGERREERRRKRRPQSAPQPRKLCSTARRKTHTDGRTHAPCVDRRRKTYGGVDVGDSHKPFLSFFLSCVLPSSPNPLSSTVKSSLSSGRGARPSLRPSVGWRRR
jgi:hypothetical protein